MDDKLTIRMWKDQAFRAEMKIQGLDVPAHPSGSCEIGLEALEQGNYITSPICSDSPKCGG